MKLARLAHLASAFALASSLCVVAHAQEPADVLYKEGTEALAAGDTALAYEKLKSAFALRPSVDIAANLALVEQQLGKHRDAAEHLAFAIKVFPPSGKPEVKRRLEGDLEKLEEKLGVVELRCPSGTTVQIGERTIGLSPVGPQYLDPGKHVVSGKHPEQGNAKVTVEVTAGQKLSVELELVPASASGAQATPASTPPERFEREEQIEDKPWWPYAALGGVAAAGLGVGLGLTFAAGGKAGDADAIAQSIDGGCDGASPPPSCADLESAIDGHNGLRIGSWIGFGVAGLASAGMLVYALLPPDTVEVSADVSIVPLIGPGQAGVGLTGRF